MSDNEQKNEKRETVADIVAEMRERADAMQTHGTTYGVRLVVLEFARRIEAAWERDAKAIATENAVLPAVCITKGGNAAAMREFAEYVANYPTCKGCNGQTDSRFCESCQKGVALAPLALKARLAISVPQTVHNAAAMLEALEDVLEKIDRWRTDGVMEHWQYSQLFDIADSALAAPQRNCDRFNTGDPMKDAEDAYCAWQRYCDNPTIPPSCKVESAFKYWLLAPAEEQKGE